MFGGVFNNNSSSPSLSLVERLFVERKVGLECSTRKVAQQSKSCKWGDRRGNDADRGGIHQFVRHYWDVFRAKSEEQLRELYARNSTGFEVAGVRTEPGKPGVARRAREYFHREAQFEVQLGSVDVTLLSNTTAVASYTFKFRARQRRVAPGKMEEESLEIVRATQVFGIEEGNVRIMHEHFSAPAG